MFIPVMQFVTFCTIMSLCRVKPILVCYLMSQYSHKTNFRSNTGEKNPHQAAEHI